MKIFKSLLILGMAVYAPWANGQELKTQNTPPKAPVPCEPQIPSSFSSPETCVDNRLLHVASPDWRDQIIYALMLDRFNDGDSTRNDQGSGEHDPSKSSHYSGGDIRGVVNKVDYIKALGATAVWISPPTASKWLDPGSDKFEAYSGYHGYWPVNFMEIDAHLGNLEDYKDLSHSLHSNGMYLIQDAVVNHVAHFYHYDGVYNPNDVTQNFTLLKNPIPPAPGMAPFHQNNVLNPAHKAANIYHWTPSITDYDDPEQLLTYQLKLVNDLNTSNPVVREALKKSYGYWIKEIGVDGFRLDAAKHVEMDFWNDFIHSDNGVEKSARKVGREDFLTFGESWEFSAPMLVTGEKKLIKFLGDDENPALKALMGFPLNSEINKVINVGKPTRDLSFRLNAHMDIYPNPYMVPNFLDSHDFPRFLADGSIKSMKQALAIIMTIPGIPIIYQGDEQAFLHSRQAMFKGGYLAKEDSFNQNSEMFSYIQSLTEIRLGNNKIFTRGSLETLNDNPLTSGIFSYKRSYEGRNAYVLLNTSDDHTTLLSHMPTGLEHGRHLRPMFSENIQLTEQITIAHDGTITLILPPRAILILEDQNMEINAIKNNPASHSAHNITIDQNYNNNLLTENTVLTGKVTGKNTPLSLVIDGNIDDAIKFHSNHKGHWKTLLPIRDMGGTEHIFEVYAPGLKSSSARQRYSSDAKPHLNLSFQDASQDDHGPSGKYGKPTRSIIKGNMDIKSADVKILNSILQLKLTMHDLSNIWAYINGFENVSFEIFFDFPDLIGPHSLPHLNAAMPESLGWNLRHKLYGAENILFTPENSSGLNDQLPYTPKLQVDIKNKAITVTYDAKKMGLKSWLGSKLYITTWDRDHKGKFRPLESKADTWIFGGGNSTDPLILDDLLIEIPGSSPE